MGRFSPFLRDIFIKSSLKVDWMDEVIFNQALQEWVEHCKKPEVQLSSYSKPVTDCEAYRKIVSMGYEALPLVRKVYDRDSSSERGFSIVKELGLHSVIREIVGDKFSIPKEIYGKVPAIEEYTKRWLDENMLRYVQS